MEGGCLQARSLAQVLRCAQSLWQQARACKRTSYAASRASWGSDVGQALLCLTIPGWTSRQTRRPEQVAQATKFRHEQRPDHALLRSCQPSARKALLDKPAVAPGVPPVQHLDRTDLAGTALRLFRPTGGACKHAAYAAAADCLCRSRGDEPHGSHAPFRLATSNRRLTVSGSPPARPRPEPGADAPGSPPIATFAQRLPTSPQSSTWSLISSELAFSSGAYMAQARVGRALNLPGISARMR